MSVQTRKRAAGLILIAFLAAGCTTAHAIYDDKGHQILMIECGSGTSMSVCYERAQTVCPTGYRTISEESGFNRKTLKVECTPESKET